MSKGFIIASIISLVIIMAFMSGCTTAKAEENLTECQVTVLDKNIKFSSLDYDAFSIETEYGTFYLPRISYEKIAINGTYIIKYDSRRVIEELKRIN